MTAKELEQDMRTAANGASFITPSQLAKYLGQKNTSRIRDRYMKEAFKIDGTNKYFLPEVARAIYESGAW